MIARTNEQLSLRGQLGNVLSDHDTLGTKVDHRRQVQMIAGDDDNIEVTGNLGHPVKLLKGIVEIGNK
jgi:hypothetical protein